MKKIVIYIVLAGLIAAMIFGSCQNTNKAPKIVTSEFNITGMTCAIGCAKTIESKIAQVAGVKTAKVDFEAKKGTFTYDENTISSKEIQQNINNLVDGKTYHAQVIQTKSCNSKKNSNKECCHE